MRCWIIGYDIADPRRLQRIHRAMLHHAIPLEYSIFLLVGTDTDHDRCIKEVYPMIDQAADDLRCYPLPKRGYQERIGKATLPAGIQWIGLPAAHR